MRKVTPKILASSALGMLLETNINDVRRCIENLIIDPEALVSYQEELEKANSTITKVQSTTDLDWDDLRDHILKEGLNGQPIDGRVLFKLARDIDSLIELQFDAFSCDDDSTYWKLDKTEDSELPSFEIITEEREEVQTATYPEISTEVEMVPIGLCRNPFQMNDALTTRVQESLIHKIICFGISMNNFEYPICSEEGWRACLGSANFDFRSASCESGVLLANRFAGLFHDGYSENGFTKHDYHLEEKTFSSFCYPSTVQETLCVQPDIVWRYHTHSAHDIFCRWEEIIRSLPYYSELSLQSSGRKFSRQEKRVFSKHEIASIWQRSSNWLSRIVMAFRCKLPYEAESFSKDFGNLHFCQSKASNRQPIVQYTQSNIGGVSTENFGSTMVDITDHLFADIA